MKLHPTVRLIGSCLMVAPAVGSAPAWAAGAVPAVPVPATMDTAVVAPAAASHHEAALRLTGPRHALTDSPVRLSVRVRSGDKAPGRVTIISTEMPGHLTTDGKGRATVLFSAPGRYHLFAHKGEVRSNLLVIVVKKNHHPACAGSAAYSATAC